ncbi:TRAP transporter small permease (plasmid) [Marinobacter sp. M3C]|jgi:TRAP-type C4-dicarboxylate transport system permease small subunit|uniref:TRAP transporter small permease n=1 Tax=Marinobacter sp. M3C TaxID=2917715 RepID=UPI00200CD8B2|nr:TRAP transporter small permease [Marinobacter sp. M3C]UQG62675.1 TRAP transporter small permease [Marinobacter sp. M3C]
MIERKHGLLAGLAVVCFRIADVFGHIASVALVVLTITLTVGAASRWFYVDGSWTYNASLFALMWMTFTGAGFCALREFHVTAGISLENFVGRGHRFIRGIRYFILIIFLAVFFFSAWNKFLETLLTHQTTADLWRWPMWIAQISAPLGVGCWLLADIGKFIESLINPQRSNH